MPTNSGPTLLRRNMSFLGRWLRNPKAVGAVIPSGKSLAAAMVAEIDREAEGAVIELGGGTGNITAALLDAGFPGQSITVIERDPTFHRLIAQRFPDVQVLQGDAAKLRRLLATAGVGKVKAIVSSLPLLSIPDRICLQIISEAMAVLGEDGTLVQFTYGPASPVSRRILTRLGLRGTRASWVMDNIPPAAVWRYHRPGIAAGRQEADQGTVKPLQKRSA
ncbi:methyltransferase domain-containing protein [Pelagibius litoralis]|uniref:Methyltransferase domain-containing protein n=1 Tax=Pelagibius litoralis TaxID=374515 RepID=A0A967KG96_9PROT|nr:methyltransferase domain-containing protein [Pelagibius litoralis]NIA70171.1 methyltransferase domain-containing protein [Pelagibius litoralis]